MNTIKIIRQSKGLKQGELAKISGISQSYLSELERNRKSNPSIDVIIRIAKSLDVNISELIES